MHFKIWTCKEDSNMFISMCSKICHDMKCNSWLSTCFVGIEVKSSISTYHILYMWFIICEKIVTYCVKTLPYRFEMRLRHDKRNNLGKGEKVRKIQTYFYKCGMWKLEFHVVPNFQNKVWGTKIVQIGLF